MLYIFSIDPLPSPGSTFIAFPSLYTSQNAQLFNKSNILAWYVQQQQKLSRYICQGWPCAIYLNAINCAKRCKLAAYAHLRSSRTPLAPVLLWHISCWPCQWENLDSFTAYCSRLSGFSMKSKALIKHTAVVIIWRRCLFGNNDSLESIAGHHQGTLLLLHFCCCRWLPQRRHLH